MDEKAETKMAVHQILIKNGFYRLPMQSLSDILKILEMPESIEPKFIQENAISGLMKVVEKYAQRSPYTSNKLSEYINLPKYAPISNETKEYVLILLTDTQAVCTKKAAFPTPNSVPPLIAQQMAPSIPPIYPPMGQMPIPQMPYMRPPSMLPPSETPNEPDSIRIMEEQMRLQQMCMYYYSMYGGFPNPMFNPGMGGYMNPYAPYPPIPPSKPNSTAPPNPMNPMMNPMIGSMNPMGPMGPMNPMNPMGSMNPMNPMNPMAPMGSMNPKMNHLNPLGAQIPPRNPLMSSQVSSVKSNNSLVKNNTVVQQGNSAQKPKEPESKAISTRVRSNQQDKDKSAQLAQQEKAQLQELKRIQRSQKRKNLQSVQKPKLNIQNPPFLVGESKRSLSTSNLREAKPQQSSETNPLFRYCACRGSQKHQDCFLCSICNQSFHYKCLSEPLRKRDNRESIECYHCRMRFIDPLNRVKEVIGEFYITNITDNKFTTQCNLKPYEHLCRVKGSKNQIEMRCLKVCHSESSEITWPDECIIKLHGERIIEIPALQMNSSLKKRKDYSILITPNVYSKVSESEMLTLDKVKLSMEIKTLTKEESANKKMKNNYIFAFAIYFVEKLTIDELFLKIINEERVPETPDYLNQLMKTNENEVEIDKITVSLKDPYTWERIRTPARGHRCHHGQCFDLHTFIAFMFSARNRSWKCPVCNKDARKFMIDSQQQEIIKRVTENGTEPSEVAFMKDGTIVLKSDPKNDDEDEPQQSSRCEKTKRINKEQRQQRQPMDRQSSQMAKESSNKMALIEPPNDVHEIHSEDMKD